MNLSSLKFWLIPLLRFIAARFVKLSQADGKAGLSLADFQQVIKQVIDVQKSPLYQNASGLTKAKAVGGWLLHEFEGEINSYIIPALVSKAYETATLKGLL